MRCIMLGTIFYVVSVAITPIQAAVLATVTAGVNETESGIGNNDSQLGFTTASASYSYPLGGSGSAYATLTTTFGGGFSAKAFATATGGSGEGEFVTMGAGASASWEDQLHYSGTPEDVFVEFVFSFTGSTSGDAQGEAGFFAFDENGIFLMGGSSTTTGQLSFGIDTPLPAGTTHYISVSLSANVTGHGSAFGLPTTSTASFQNSFTLIAITPRDADGNFLPDVVITADSGFDYNPLIREVPEPTSATLALFGLLALLRQRRKRG